MLFSFFKQKRIKKRRLAIILIIALLLFAAFSLKGLYDHFLYSRDSLIQYFPENTVVYAHGTFHGSVFGQLRDFLAYHPTFDRNVLQQELAKVATLWPHIPTQAREISLGLVALSDTETAPKLAVLFSNTEAASAYTAQLDEEKWQFLQRENVIEVWPRGVDISVENNLHDYFSSSYLPISNDWYVFIKNNQGIAALQDVFSNQYRIDFFDHAHTDRENILYSLRFRDNTAILTTAPQILGSERTSQDMFDTMQAKDYFVAKKISLTNSSVASIASRIATKYPNTQTTPGIVTRLELEKDYIQSLGIDPAIDIAYIYDQEPTFVLQVTTDAPPEDIIGLVRTLASYDFPQAVQQILRDGSRIVEYKAGDHDGIRVNTQDIYGNIVYTIAAGDEMWEYQLLFTDTGAIVTNNIEVLNSNFALEQEKMSFCRLGESYAYQTFPIDVEAVLGLGMIAYTSLEDEVVICLR